MNSNKLELHWLDQTEAAYGAFHQQNYKNMFDFCGEALEIAENFPKNDPRCACSLNNRGVALYLLHEEQQARKTFLEGYRLWQHAQSWVEQMTLATTGRSSLFHLRMRQKHRATYESQGQRHSQELLCAGGAFTLTNLANLLMLKKRVNLAQTLYAQALVFRKKRFGAEDHGVLAIQITKERIALNHGALEQLASVSVPFRPIAFQRHWLMDEPPEFNDLGRLNTAVRLTFLLIPIESQ